MFAAIRRTDTLVAAALELGIKQATLLARLDTLEGHRELPDDIRAKRPRVFRPLDGESFEERRQRAASERADKTWRERTGGA